VIRCRSVAASLLVAGSLVLVSAVASAVVSLPAPGTAAQVSRLVGASHAITSLNTALKQRLLTALADNAGRGYPITKNGCATLTKCVFGDTKASKTVVLFGDSHAQMWIPAMNRIGVSHKLKVALLFLPSCPAASLDVWLRYTNTAFGQCTAARKNWIAAVDKLHPVLVVLADRTTSTYTLASQGTQLFTDAQWKSGLETTITGLAASKAKIAILGDTTAFNSVVPVCLAAYPTQVQMCAVPDPNPAVPGHQGAERAAAIADGASYIDTSKWLCTSTCSPVIGNYIVYTDQTHITMTYAGYLSGVLSAALKALL